MSVFWQHFLLSAPLFAIVLAGYLLSRWARWRPGWTSAASKFVFAVALPAMLFRLMIRLSALPPVDARLLIAFFGGCLLVFVIGRVIAARVFHRDGVSQSVFALGGVFSNNVLLGLPLAKLTLGEAALPSVALVIVFNALTLWTLVSVSVEWARHGSFSLAGFARTAFGVLTNPLIAGILLGSALGLSGLQLPGSIDVVLGALGEIAPPAALLVLGMGLAHYDVRPGLDQAVTICLLKLLIHPLVVWGLAAALALPPTELKVVVLLASMAVGANVYVMSVQFQTLQGTIASAILLSTMVAAITTPILLWALSVLT